MKDKQVVDIIEELSCIMKKNKLSLINFKNDDFELKLSSEQTILQAPASVPLAASPAPVDQATAMQSNSATQDNKITIKSPMLGVVYMSNSPGEPPFVSKGATVKAGETVCLIETMKTFSPIKAEQDCIIKDILVSNNETVEYDEDIFVIEYKA